MFSIKKGLIKFLTGGGLVLLTFATQNKEDFTRIFIPENLATAAVLGAVFEIFDYILNQLKKK